MLLEYSAQSQTVRKSTENSKIEKRNKDNLGRSLRKINLIQTVPLHIEYPSGGNSGKYGIISSKKFYLLQVMSLQDNKICNKER